MPLMQIQSEQIGDGGVRRDDLNITTSGQAVIRKAVAGTGISLSSTGADTGTGDVTITATGVTEYGRIANYGGETDASGWSASGANFTIARTTTSGEVLRGTGSLELTANGSQAVNDYISHSFTLDLGDRNRMLTVEFYFKGTSNFDSGDCDIVFHDGTNEILPSVSQIPGGEGYFQATWVSTSASSYTIRFKAKVTTAFSFVIDNVYVDAKEVVRANALGDFTPYTLTIGATTTAPTEGGGSKTKNSWWRREGDSMRIVFEYRQTTGGSAGTGDYLFPLPASYNIDSTKITSASSLSLQAWGCVGFGTAFNGSNSAALTVAVYDATRLQLQINAGHSSVANLVSSTNMDLGNADTRYFFSALVPIDGWSSDVVLAHENVEYVYNSSVTDGNDSSSYASGINGGKVPSVTSDHYKEVQLPRPFRHVRLEFQDVGGDWIEVGSSPFSRQEHFGTTRYGALIQRQTDTTYRVYFLRAGYVNATGASVTWATAATAGVKWRVVASDTPSAVETSDKVVQVVYEEITTSGTFSSAQIPFDDTLPQNTEGAELLTATITPRYANSYLIVEAQAFVGENTDSSHGAAMALFRDSTADAFATSFSVAQSSASSPFGTSIIAIPLRAGKRLNSVAPTPTTIKMRIGLDEVATVRYNGANGSRQFGGSLVSYLKIIEVRA